MVAPAVVFDIDGVLRLGERAVEGAPKMIERLRQLEIPHLFLSNTSSSPQKVSDNLKTSLGIDMDRNQFVVSHSPFAELLAPFQGSTDPLLVVGIDKQSAADVRNLYNIPNAIGAGELFEALPSDSVPSLAPKHCQRSGPVAESMASSRFAGIVVMADSDNWTRDIQLVLDALRFGGRCSPAQIKTWLDAGGDDKQQHIPIFFANPDFVYGAAHPSPRLTQGAFRAAVETLFERATGKHLDVTQVGKPSAISYRYAATLLGTQSSVDHDKVYMIGDNPESDIRGANGAGWVSCLVRTGIGARVDVDALPVEDRPRLVFPTVVEAVQHIIDEVSR